MPPKSEAKNIQAYEPFRVVISERLFLLIWRLSVITKFAKRPFVVLPYFLPHFPHSSSKAKQLAPSLFKILNFDRVFKWRSLSRLLFS